MIYFISDLHLDHEKILTFKRADGSPLRDFNSIEEHNGTLVSNWNQVVTEKDTVYVLGDIAWNDGLIWMKAMKGRKILIKGNHDNFINVRKFLEVFDDVHGVYPMHHQGTKMVLSHVPIHEDSIGRWGFNIHGHTHEKDLIDGRYINVSCEAVHYMPISFNSIKNIMDARTKDNA